MAATNPEASRQTPYQGLTPFNEGDARYFFGRERDSRLLAADLFAAPLTLVYGASGVGKSSVLRAGVLPLLRQRTDVLPVIFSGWQSEPITGIKSAVATELFATEKVGSNKYRSHQDTVLFNEYDELPEFLQKVAKAAKRRLLIILDQFEESALYQTADKNFVTQFARATRLKDLSASFILSLREEALARLDRFEGYIPTLFDSFRRIDHLEEEAARLAIVAPLKKFAEDAPTLIGPNEIEEDLITAVLEDVRTGNLQVSGMGLGKVESDSSERIEAPYLQLVMTRLWNEEAVAGSSTMRLETLSRLGRAENIVKTHLDTVMGKFDLETQTAAARAFQYLVTPSGAKIAYTVSDLAASAAVDLATISNVVQVLTTTGDRILREVAPAAKGGESRYEIFHDRLAPAILAWRTRQLHESELKQVKQQEFGLVEVAEHSTHAVLNLLDPKRQHIAAQVFRLLAAPDRKYKWRTAHGLARDGGVNPPELDEAIRAFLEYGLLVQSRSRDRGEVIYSVAHESFCPALFKWSNAVLAGRPPSVGAPVARQIEKAPDERPSPPSAGRPRPPYSTILDQLRRGRVVVVVGAGVSASGRRGAEEWTPGGISSPLSGELARYLSDRVRYQTLDGIPSLPEVASYYALTMGRDALNRALREVFTPEPETTAAHRFLAQCASERPFGFLTTTFDTTMQRALDEADVPYDLAYNAFGPDGNLQLFWQPHGETQPKLTYPREVQRTSGNTLVYKIFGSFARESSGLDSYILAEEDQMLLFAALLEGKLLPPAFEKEFIGLNALFMGTSLSGWTERMLFSALRGKRASRDLRNWAIVRGLSMIDRVRWEAFGVEPYDESVESFVNNAQATS